MQRTILHCDLNNFFASVACHDNPQLCSKPIAVCGSVKERRGIVLAKNELAKSFGVKTAEPVWQAQAKCRDLIIVAPDYDRYLRFSALVTQIYSEYTDQVEAFGIDECWLDVTGSRLLFGDGEQIAERIRNRVKNELGLTVSIGVSFNKVFAKLGGDLKKPDAITVIPYTEYKNIVWPLKISCLLGIGPNTEKKLHNIGIFTIGNLAATNPAVLKSFLGKNGELLGNLANGHDPSPVKHLTFRNIPKSIGRSNTFIKDTTSSLVIRSLLFSLSDEIASILRTECLEAKTVQIFVRHNDFSSNVFQTILKHPTQLSTVIAKEGMLLFQKHGCYDRPIRAAGIRVLDLCEKHSAYQLDIFDNPEKETKLLTIENCVDTIRNRFGKQSVSRAVSLFCDKF